MLVRRFILLFTILSAIVLAITYPIYAQYYKGLKESILANEETSVVAAKQMIQNEMYEQIHLLTALTSSPELISYVTSRTKEQRLALEEQFKNISTNYHRFDQIRLLNNSGIELIRVNLADGKGVVVPQVQLQDKSQRYYFKATEDLADNQVFVSRLDLNVEQGQIEQPYKPMLRFSTPVVDGKGERAGILVLNYLAKGMLERFRKQMSQRVEQQGMLLDPDGYWLSNHKLSNEWGADLGRPENTFANLYPQAWPEVNAAASGTITTEQGLFRFQNIEPFNFANSQHAHYSAEHYPLFASQSIVNTDWKLVIFVPYNFILSRSFLYQPLGQSLLALLFLLIAGATLLIVVVTSQQQVRAKEQKKLKNIFKDLYDNAPCGYHSLDKEGLFIRINQTELKWLGYAHAEVIGQPFVNFLTPESKSRFQVFFDTLQTEDEIENIVLKMQCKDGSTFYVSSSATALKDESGRFTMVRSSVFDITDRIKLEKELEVLANIDPLTNISNRRHFYKKSSFEFKRAVRYQHELAILMLDIDYFKRVNDTYGHDAGDVVLKQLASKISETLRDLDIFARFGGEEFIALLPELSSEQAALVAERVRQETAAMPIELPSGEIIRVTISLGFAMLTAEDKQLDALIKKADLALYQAKAQGRDRVVQYSTIKKLT